MDDFRFNSLKDLYQKLKPALKTKVNELKRNNVTYINEEDIWNYLRGGYWNNKAHLTLGEMVNDILSTPNYQLEEYVKKQFKTKKENSDDNLL